MGAAERIGEDAAVTIDAAVAADPERFMRLALDEARISEEAGDLPIGAVAVRGGEVIATAHNRRALDRDPTAHAEMLVLRDAAASIGDWHLDDVTVVVTLEPCPMCAGAASLARVARIVLGAWDPKAGACGSVWDLVRDRQALHRVEVVGGVRAAECSALLRDFFTEHR